MQPVLVWNTVFCELIVFHSNKQTKECYICLYVSLCTNLRRSTTPGEEVSIIIAMERDVEDAGIIVEDFLGAVAMMNILND